ncbi:MAG: hypothetical protein GVY11_02765 [Gammaproteobacteria bacterium]|nr:hypothetical protein [Gammaproteobacteria bacterium]
MVESRHPAKSLRRQIGDLRYESLQGIKLIDLAPKFVFNQRDTHVRRFLEPRGSKFIRPLSRFERNQSGQDHADQSHAAE